MTLSENYNTLIIQECTGLSMITQHINNTYILTTNTHTYNNNSANTTHKHIHTYLLVAIVVIDFIKNK